MQAYIPPITNRVAIIYKVVFIIELFDLLVIALDLGKGDMDLLAEQGAIDEFLYMKGIR